MQCLNCNKEINVSHEERIVPHSKMEGRWCSHMNGWLCHDCYNKIHEDPEHGILKVKRE